MYKTYTFIYTCTFAHKYKHVNNDFITDFIQLLLFEFLLPDSRFSNFLSVY